MYSGMSKPKQASVMHKNSDDDNDDVAQGIMPGFCSSRGFPGLTHIVATGVIPFASISSIRLW